MIKEGIKRTLIMLGVYILCIGSILGVLIYNFKTFETDYTESVSGNWSAVQYFKDKKVHPYTEEDGFDVYITGDSVECVFHNEQESVRGEFVWKNGYSGTIHMEDGFESFVSIDMNTRGDLKLNVTQKGMIILLRKMEVNP